MADTGELPSRPPASGRRSRRDVDSGLLRLTAEIAGLDAVALFVRDGEAGAVRASWPRDQTGLELEAPDAEDWAKLLIAVGGSGGEALVVELHGDDGLEAVLCGSLPPERSDPGEAAMRAMETLADLIVSRLQLESARRRAEDATTRMASLVDVGVSLGQELRLDDLLAHVVQAAREVLGARYAALGVLDPTGTELDQFVTAGLSADERAAIGNLPRGRGLLGVLIRDARPLRLDRISDDPRSSGFPPNHPPMESFLGVPVGLRGKVFGNLYLADKAGGSFTAEDEQIALTFAAQAAVAVDNVHRYEAERRRADELESVREVARAVLGTLDLDTLLPLVARRARSLTGADTVGVAVAEGEEVVFRHAHGLDALSLEGSRGPRDIPELEAALRETMAAHSVEACSLELGGESAGALVAVGSRPFDDGARRLLETFSSQVAIALVNARAVAAQRERILAEAAREAATAREQAAAEGLRRAIEAQEAERARVARELHDEAGQVLTALALHLRAMEDDVPEGEARQRVADLRSSVNAAAGTLRELATRLRPSALREQGLAAAIEEQAGRLRKGAGIPVEVDLRGLRVQLPDDAQVALFRVVQEALTNVARHSGAGSASIVATAHASRLRLVVEDDGRGFEPTRPTSRLGIAGIRERVELLGGRLRIESAPGGGTAVVVDLELPA